MAEFDLPDDVRDDARAAWQRYLDELVPFRPELHAYCRRLTGDPWDAEDLVQETVLRGFSTLGSVHGRIANPRGYLVRIASNLWMDALRRRGVEDRARAEERPPRPLPHASPSTGAEVREAGARLLQRLSPQERAALLMKEVFDMRLSEIAEALSTSIAAVKAALHRGRGRLAEDEGGAAAARPLPSVALVDRFARCVNENDFDGLLELMLDTGSVEEVGSLVEVGRHEFSREGSWLWQSVHVHPELPPERRPRKWWNERAIYRGEPIVLGLDVKGDRRRLSGVTRFVEEDGRIARIRSYIFCPELIREIGAELGLEVRTGLYRFPTPAPGRYWRDERRP